MRNRIALTGALYFVVGAASVVLAGTAASAQGTKFWRWAAFAICGIIFANHIARELVRHHATAREAASRAAGGVAFGAFGLALMANIHELSSASAYRPRMLAALVTWPTVTAVPAFLAALAAASIVTRTGRT